MNDISDVSQIFEDLKKVTGPFQFSVFEYSQIVEWTQIDFPKQRTLREIRK